MLRSEVATHIVEIILKVQVNSKNQMESSRESTSWNGQDMAQSRTLNLLNKHAHVLSAEAVQNDPATAFEDVSIIPCVRKRAWCFACALCLQKGTTELGYRCELCDGSYLHLCFVCVDLGIKCREGSHSLVLLQEGQLRNRFEYVNF